MNIIDPFIRLYAVLTGGFLLLRRSGARYIPLIGLISNFSFWLTLPAVILAPLLLLWRRWLVSLLLLPTAIYCVITYATRFRSNGKPALAPQGKQLTILTYNMHAEDQHLAEVVAVIAGSGADVVAIQEFSVEADSYFLTHLQAIYPHQRVHHNGSRTDGQGILSKYPILDDDYWQNPVNSLVLGHQRAHIDWKGTTIALYNLHPIHPGLVDGKLYDEMPRGQEIEVALNKAAQERVPVIMVGDFNMSEESLDYQRITAEYRDVYRAVGQGMGFTFPDHSQPQSRADGKLPLIPILLIRLDYCFVSSEWTPLEAQVWHSSGGSDHRPLRAKLLL